MGTISVGIRYRSSAPDAENGEAYSFQHRWTNDLPWRIMQRSFLNGGEKLSEFIADANGTDPDYCRATPHLQRSEYGFLLLDFVNGQGWSASHYSRFGIATWVPSTSTGEQKQLAGLLELCEDGHIERAEWLSLASDAGDEKEGWHPATASAFADAVRSHCVKPKFKHIIWQAYLNHPSMKIELRPSGDSDALPTLKEARAWMDAHGWKKF